MSGIFSILGYFSSLPIEIFKQFSWITHLQCDHMKGFNTDFLFAIFSPSNCPLNVNRGTLLSPY